MNISKTARLPYTIVRGSIQKRKNLADNLNDTVFNKIIPQKQITQNMLRDILQETLGDVSILINGNTYQNKKTRGYCGIRKDKLDNVCGFEIALPFNKCKLLKDKYSVLMHEISHLHTCLTNPKIIARSICVSKIKNINKEKFYETFLYSKYKFDEEFVNSQFNIIFSKLKDQEKLDLLQSYRYRLMDEQNAYREEFQYFNKLEQNGIQQMFKSRSGINSDFSSKIKYLENKIRELIKQMRNNY